MTWPNDQVTPPYAIGQATLGYVQPNGAVVLSLCEAHQDSPEKFAMM